MSNEATCKLGIDSGVFGLFDGFPDRVYKNVVGKLLRRGAAIAAAAGKEQAPTESGLMRLAIGETRLATYSGGTMFITAGVRRGFRRMVTAKARGGLRYQSAKISAAATSGTFRDPAKYVYPVSAGRKVSWAPKGRHALFSAASGRFFKSAAAVSPNPFMNRAFDNCQSAILTMIQQEAPGLIEAEAAKLK